MDVGITRTFFLIYLECCLSTLLFSTKNKFRDQTNFKRLNNYKMKNKLFKSDLSDLFLFYVLFESIFMVLIEKKLDLLCIQTKRNVYIEENTMYIEISGVQIYIYFIYKGRGLFFISYFHYMKCFLFPIWWYS